MSSATAIQSSRLACRSSICKAECMSVASTVLSVGFKMYSRLAKRLFVLFQLRYFRQLKKRYNHVKWRRISRKGQKWTTALDRRFAWLQYALDRRWCGYHSKPAHHFKNNFTGAINQQLHHVDWVGFTFEDIIKPLFMFVVGVSMVFSFEKASKRMGGKKCPCTSSDGSPFFFSGADLSRAGCWTSSGKVFFSTAIHCRPSRPDTWHHHWFFSAKI